MKNIVIGQLINTDAQRDAVHVAVLPAFAGETLKPGESVKFNVYNNSAAKCESKIRIGIVDPFLQTKVKTGQKFFIFIEPNTITSLKHDWEHPDLVEKPQITKEKAAANIKALAESYDISYKELLYAAQNFLDYGDYLSDGGKFEGLSIPDSFWDDYETVTGQTVPHNLRDSFFSCSC